MHMKQAICDQAKMELRNKPWLDQPSNHYKVKALSRPKKKKNGDSLGPVLCLDEL